MTTPQNILVTGSNRGIGLELVRQLANMEHPPKLIIATCRNLQTSKDLLSLEEIYSNVKVIHMDVEREESIISSFEETSRLVGSSGLNVLINNAAINMRQTSITSITAEDMRRMFNVNVVGPALVTKIFLPLLQRAANMQTGSLCWSRAALVNISSQLGSIGENYTGGSYQYRESKAALNQLTKNLSIELTPRGILAINFHPGRVRTDMGGPNADIEPAESVRGTIEVLNRINSECAGKLYSYTGRIIQW